MTNRYKARGFDFPILFGFFMRELLAVTLYLLLEWRARDYDFFTTAFVLILVLLTLRIPYVNAYTFLLEVFGMADWELSHHAGMHGSSFYNMYRALVVLTAHVGGAIAAAALRVYWDVAYGIESVTNGRPGVVPSLSVDPNALRALDGFWSADQRLERIGNSTALSSTIPLGPDNYLGIGQVSLMSWYVLEDAGYVLTVCVITIHIWLYVGLGEGNGLTRQNPFGRRYWHGLFVLCLMLSLLNAALCRAFPTAHGSPHNTIFKWQYQAWNPSVRLVDNENSEVFMRVVGGFLGLALAYAYNRLLVSTEKRRDDDDSGDLWFKMVWGFDPDQLHSRERRVRGDADDTRKETRRSLSEGRSETRCEKSCVVIKLPENFSDKCRRG